MIYRKKTSRDEDPVTEMAQNVRALWIRLHEVTIATAIRSPNKTKRIVYVQTLILRIVYRM